MAPRFVIGIGTQKAATTTLAKFLEDQGVAMHPQKELHAFGRANRELTSEEYLSKFPTLPDSGWFSEFTPEYCLQAHALLNIKRIFPDVKVVFCYRNPIDRLQSAYRHAAAASRIDRNLSMDDVIDLSFRGHQNHWIENLLNFGKYDLMLDIIDRVFGMKDVYIVRQEDLGTVNERAALNGLLRMLELEDLPADSPLVTSYNTSDYHREQWSYAADSTISESNLDRLHELYAPVEAAMRQRGLRTEWF